MTFMTAIAENFHDAPIPRTSNRTTWLGLLCMSAAVLSGILKGVWEMARPILVTPETFASAAPLQLWIHCLLEVFKSAGFLAGLFGFYIFATKRGPVTKVFMVLAVLGGIFYAGVWMWMTATTRFTIIYVLGGMWYQMVGPVALGIAAIFARRVAWWKAVFAIVV